MIGYIRASLNLPIWLFSPIELTVPCDRAIVGASWWQIQRELWPYKVALAVTEWDYTKGNWLIKSAPFTIPFFHPLIRNISGGYFAGSPGKVWHYVWLGIRRWLDDAWTYGGELALGALLWVFAFFAQWNSALSRAVFRRLHGTRHLSLEAVPRGEGIGSYRYTGRKWDVRRIAEMEGAYGFFQREDDHSDPSDLLAPFRDPDTFAVSRQHAVRSWRKLLFATAPFRVLQVGEASRVYAPVSPAMLVDLAKLRALGIPSLSSFGSNWYLLFYKAAAAGWHSYSVGPGTATELAAVPFDEAEFVRAVVEDPLLRGLAPRAPALSRGNVVASPSHGPGVLPRVLIVSPYLPFPLSHGGAVRIWNLCRALSDRVDFTLACFREKADIVQYDKLHEVFRGVYIVDIDEKHHNPSLPKQVNGYESSTMRELIRSIPADIVQFEYTQMAAYREAAAARPAILVEHDLTFALYRQLAQDREYQLWLAFERERLRAFDCVWTMSPLDREQAIAEGSPADRTIAVPNGVDLDRFRCPPPDPASQQVIYVGSFRHLPNYLAFEELRTRIMPGVWKTRPEATLQVVAGPDHFAYWTGTRELDPRITVHGFVADLVPLYASAAVVVVPLPVSAGTNIKLMEALSCERPVVSTPVGCAGLELVDGRDLLVRELGPGFASAVAELLANPSPVIAKNGFLQAQQRFGWNAIAETAYNSYSILLSELRA